MEFIEKKIGELLGGTFFIYNDNGISQLYITTVEYTMDFGVKCIDCVDLCSGEVVAFTSDTIVKVPTPEE